jgi:hypothetical protein
MDDIGSFKPTQERLLPLSHEVTTLHDPLTGMPYAAILSSGELIEAAPSNVGRTWIIGALHNVLPAPFEPTIPYLTIWDGAAPDRHGGFTKGEMLGDYAVTGALYKEGPGFKVQSKSWAQRMKALQAKAQRDDQIENLIVASEV